MMTLIKRYGRSLMGLRGFIYDYSRFIKYNSWNFKCSNNIARQYHLAKLTHTLEKSMSFKNKRKGAGYNNAKKIFDILVEVDKNNHTKFFNDYLALKTLEGFCKLSLDIQKFEDLYNNLPQWSEADDIHLKYGVHQLSSDEILKGKLNNPEVFFNSRYSTRDFQSQIVNNDIVDRALQLAQKTPSSCNMQPWHVYKINDKKNINLALSFQTGNSGFSENIYNLLIITSDQQSFISSSERYQHWIDGGLYSMSLIYALHSLGISTCCLNWSENPSKDIAIRKALNIKENHSIIMMLAFGFPCNENLICISPRKNITDIKTEI